MPSKTSTKVLSWAENLDQNTIDQAEVSSRAPFIPSHIALMPDAHFGYGVTIGSVIPTQGAIIPSAVGVDIGCGMAALKLDMGADELPDTLGPLLSLVEQGIPPRTHGEETKLAHRFLVETADVRHSILNQKESAAALSQLGTLGSGNHFVEVCLDASDKVWLVLHSGSRGVGNQLAQKHINKAKGFFKDYFMLDKLDDPDLAYFIQGTPEFDAYWKDVRWAQGYAAENRSVMLSSFLKATEAFLDRRVKVVMSVNCHHNYVALEHHMGQNLYITRKGAISAKVGEMGIIPGSMGTNTFIVKGLGNKASYMSAPHGAGRKMSRRKARETFSAEDLAESMGDRAWMGDKASKLTDEHPGAYKDINEVMRLSSDLVEVVYELHQILNYKGT